MREQGRRNDENKDRRQKNLVRRFFSSWGPDQTQVPRTTYPSGVATYTIAGAQLGTSLLWTHLVDLAAHGLRAIYVCAHRCGNRPRSRRRAAAEDSAMVADYRSDNAFAANFINVGADLSGMADAAEMLTGFNSHWFVVIFGPRHRVSNRPLSLLPNRDDLEMAGTLPSRLRYHCVRGEAGLEQHSSRHFCSNLAERSRYLANSRRDSRHHHQPSPFLLAVFAGSGTGKGDGSANARAKRRRQLARDRSIASSMSAQAHSFRTSSCTS